jgi:hypothetical protein
MRAPKDFPPANGGTPGKRFAASLHAARIGFVRDSRGIGSPASFLMYGNWQRKVAIPRIPRTFATSDMNG